MIVTENRKKYSKEIGDTAESIFKNLMESKGCIVSESLKEQNKFDNIDYFVTIGDKTFSFDVKTKHSESVWMEIKNIAGFKGSIYGKQTHFALYYHNLNILATVKRTDMLQYVKDNVIREIYIAKKGILVPYHYCYRREGRKDLLMKTKREFLQLTVPSYKEYIL